MATPLKSRILLFINLALFATPLFALTNQEITQKIIKQVHNGAVVLNDEYGHRLVSYNEDKIFLPASIVKIITSMFALDILGDDFRFRTEFFLDAKNNLTIKGYGDPFLISREIEQISRALKQKGLKKIHQIYLDPSAFSTPIIIPGTSHSLNPYDALNGALAVNFNTINIGKTRKGKVFSAEEETPLTPLARKKSTQIRRGTKDRISLAESPKESLQYAGEIFIAFLKKADIKIENMKILVKAVSQDSQLLYQHRSTHSLHSILAGLLKYSNNYIANQIFLIIGARQKGFPASLSKSRAVLNFYIKNKLPPQNGELKIEEASGLSRNNRITASYMLKVLDLFKTDHSLIAKKYGAFLKSGTLTGVYNYAGYLETTNGLRPFVILLNQPGNNQLKIVKLLQKIK